MAPSHHGFYPYCGHVRYAMQPMMLGRKGGVLTLKFSLPATAAVRVYALWDRDSRLFITVFLLGIFPAATNLVRSHISFSIMVLT